MRVASWSTSQLDRESDNSASECLADISLNTLGLLFVVFLIYALFFRETVNAVTAERSKVSEALVASESKSESLIQQVTHLSSERDQLADNLAGVATERDSAVSSMNRTNKSLEAASRVADDLKDQIEQQSGQLDSVRSQLGRAEASNRTDADQIEQLDSQLATAERQREAEKRAMATAQQNHRLREKELLAQIKASPSSLAEFNSRVIRPLTSARLVVRVSCDNLPDGLDLDLWVLDPKDALCFWKSPRVLDAHRVTGSMILSEQLASPPGHAEESWFTNYPIESGTGPYLVSCMLRRTDGGDEQTIDAVTVHYEIHGLRGTSQVPVLTGDISINAAGQVYTKGDGDISASALIPAIVFRLRNTSGTVDIVRETLHDRFRGWRALDEIPKGSNAYSGVSD